MKTLKLNDYYQITTDKDNYILQEIGVVQAKESKNYGKETISNIGYYSNIKSLIRALGERTIREGIDNLTEAQKSLDELKNSVKRLNLIEA